MKQKLLLVMTCLLVAGVLPAQAQFTQDPNDLGEADSIDLVVTVCPEAATNQLKIQLDLYVFNDSNTLIGATMGFFWDNPNLQIDSAVASPLTDSAFDLGPFFYEDNNINITNANQRFLFGGATLFAPGVSGAPNRQLWASYFFTLSSWSVSDSVLLDTLEFNAGSEYMFVGEGSLTYIPFWTGKTIVRDCNVANLLVIPDSLYFTAVEGGSSPPPQSFLVSSDAGPLNFDILENISWAVPSPIQGITNQTINVLINIIGLPAGTYIDSLEVQSVQATNSPQYVKLVLEIVQPPPTIGVDPDAFFFNAIAGESNPSPETLIVTNTGGSTLNWTVSKSESWLGLNPTSGVDSGDVSVSVDITSLPFGTYYDTIVVSDTNATNDPVLVPVILNVASELPVIDVDSAFFFVVWPSDSIFLPYRYVQILNAGGGTMNFWLEEESSRIFSLNPSSGTAPQTIEVGFKGGGTPGQDYYDTLWVHSNEAINSPFPIVYLFHIVEDPAVLFVTRDSIQLNVFECDMGYDVDMPRVTFFVNNIGGDNPMPFQVVYESIYFTTNIDTGTAQFPITIIANDIQLPLGTYLDTILVVAQTAINSPETLIVQFNMIAALTQPEIFLTKSSYNIPTQENSGPIPPSALAIFNRFGGCMPWDLQEAVPWLFITPDSGDVPGGVDLHVDAAGYLCGEYTDSMLIIAPSASNSPRKVDLLLQVWRFHGDLDYNCEINIADLTYLVDFLFRLGPEPIPERVVADLNCSHLVNVADLTYFVDFFFNKGPIPCGNPFK